MNMSAMNELPSTNVSSDSDKADALSLDRLPALSRRLFISHFLSTWNSRVFEFGAVLFLASIYPNTLLPMSVYALARGVSAILFAPAVGSCIDTQDRLQVVRFSISELCFLRRLYQISDNVSGKVVQRLAVAASCLLLSLLATEQPFPPTAKAISLVLLAGLACIEKLCSIMNLISIERDWVGSDISCAELS